MTEPNVPSRPIDAERIAALIDGRLGAAERDAIIAELQASPEAFEVYADAVAALRDDEDDQPGAAPPAPVVAMRPARTRTALYAGIGAIAAALLVVVGLPFVRGSSNAANTPQALVMLLERPNDAAAAAAALSWDAVRRGADDVPTRAQAVRIGVRLVDLEVLMRSGDTASAARVARHLSSMLDAIPAGSIAAAAYRDMAESPVATSDARRSAASVAEQVAGATNVRLGAWLETARMAAITRDAAFFSQAPADRALSAVADLPQTSTASVAQLRKLVQAPSRDWPAIETTVAELLRQLAAPGT